jgi:hypothetical protein
MIIFAMMLAAAPVSGSPTPADKVRIGDSRTAVPPGAVRVGTLDADGEVHVRDVAGWHARLRRDAARLGADLVIVEPLMQPDPAVAMLADRGAVRLYRARPSVAYRTQNPPR